MKLYCMKLFLYIQNGNNVLSKHLCSKTQEQGPFPLRLQLFLFNMTNSDMRAVYLGET